MHSEIKTDPPSCGFFYCKCVNTSICRNFSQSIRCSILDRITIPKCYRGPIKINVKGGSLIKYGVITTHSCCSGHSCCCGKMYIPGLFRDVEIIWFFSSKTKNYRCNSNFVIEAVKDPVMMEAEFVHKYEETDFLRILSIVN